MNVRLDVTKREMGKKSDRKNLRKNGFIPDVINGDGAEGICITLTEGPFMAAFKKSFALVTFFDMNVDGQEYHTIVKEYQIHPVSRKVVHVDFLLLRADKEVELKIPIDFVGEPIGLKKSGRLETLVRAIKVSCLPGNAVEKLKVDISHLHLAEKIRISDVKAEGINILTNSMTTLAVVHAPRGMTGSEIKEAISS